VKRAIKNFLLNICDKTFGTEMYCAIKIDYDSKYSERVFFLQQLQFIPN